MDQSQNFKRLWELELRDEPLVILKDFTAFRLDATWHDLSNQGVGTSLLRALVESERPLDHVALGEILYPGERLLDDALVNRINVQISKLRALGLKPHIKKLKQGFVLDIETHVET